MGARPVLIFYCEEGEGHASAARALAELLAAGGAQTVVHDALQHGLGRLIAWGCRDAYRFQVRWLRWTYGVEYFLFTRVAPARAVARFGLAFFGSRPLLRLIEQHSPSVIVSTHPAVTNVLGSLRRRGRIAVPAVATITDFGVHALWAHGDVDVHLVMHERLVRSVERVAGAGSARVVDPLIGAAFRTTISQHLARRALGLPARGPIALISGGGWGVGDIERAAEAALGVPGLTVVCLTGKNELLRGRLERRLGGADRLVIVPFTNRMPELLAAADVLVDSTLGVTCLEALSAGCQVIAYGAPPGHSRENARALAGLGLANTVRSRPELTERLRELAAAPAQTRVRPALARDPADAVLSAQLHTRQRRKPRRALVAVASATATLGLAGWSVATPTPYPLLARTLNLTGLSQVSTDSALAGVIVEAPSAQIPQLAFALSTRGIHASFAVAQLPSARVRKTVAAQSDELIPTASPAETPGVEMIRFSTHLHGTARRLGYQGRFYYLRPENGYTVGDFIAARLTGGRAVAPSFVVGPEASHLRDLRSGRVVLLEATGPAATEAVTRLAAVLAASGMRGVSLAELLASARQA